MNSKATGRRLTGAMLALLFASTSQSTYASPTSDKAGKALSAPINAKVVKEGAQPLIDDAVSSNGSDLKWSAPIRPLGAASSFHWSLPMDGPVGAMKDVLRTARRVIRHTPKPVPKKLEGGIALADDNDKVGQRIDELLDAALDRNEKTRTLDKAVAHYRSTTQKVIAESKDATNYLVPFRGCAVSSEAGDIILDEQVKLKSRASAEYARQRHIDDIHVKVVTNMMQVAMGLGMADKTRGDKVVATGMAALKDLVGESEAQRTLQMLASWERELNIPESVYKKEVWDITQRQHKFKYVMATALENDQVIHEIKKRVHKYNQHGKVFRVTDHVVQTTLGVASLTPTFIGPAAKVALLGYVMATGGPESCKLLKELYLDKRFESRWKVINEEAHMAIENYQLALLTRNPVLLACSESLIGTMAGQENVVEVFGQSILASAAPAPAAEGEAPDGETEGAGTQLVQSAHVVSQ